jgi:hypothetical protein
MNWTDLSLHPSLVIFCINHFLHLMKRLIKHGYGPFRCTGSWTSSTGQQLHSKMHQVEGALSVTYCPPFSWKGDEERKKGVTNVCLTFSGASEDQRLYEPCSKNHILIGACWPYMHICAISAAYLQNMLPGKVAISEQSTTPSHSVLIGRQLK